MDSFDHACCLQNAVAILNSCKTRRYEPIVKKFLADRAFTLESRQMLQLFLIQAIESPTSIAIFCTNLKQKESATASFIKRVSELSATLPVKVKPFNVNPPEAVKPFEFYQVGTNSVIILQTTGIPEDPTDSREVVVDTLEDLYTEKGGEGDGNWLFVRLE